MSSLPLDLTTAPTNPPNLFECPTCGRARACPYAPIYFTTLVKYVGCDLCGDVCVHDYDANVSALKAVLSAAGL